MEDGQVGGKIIIIYKKVFNLNSRDFKLEKPIIFQSGNDARRGSLNSKFTPKMRNSYALGNRVEIFFGKKLGKKFQITLQ